MSKETNHIYNKTGEKPFTIANSDLLLNKDLTVNDKMIYLYLRLYGGQNRLAFTGLERMSEEINLSINTIRKSLKNLEGKKYIKITKEKQKHGYYLNNYHIFDPYNNNQEKIFDKENSIKKEQPI
ncbi:MAG TPA: helix-turn-helix domain-containing protein, partial [Candidatus Coprovivens excrementavium]|nr:helix-turn-helix domain-containing protein [Candidatus Coprovivens excrementavium]